MNTYSYFGTTITTAVAFCHTYYHCTSLSLTCYPRPYSLFLRSLLFVLFSQVSLDDTIDVTCFSFSLLPAGGSDPYFPFLIANKSNGSTEPRNDVGQSVWCMATSYRTWMLTTVGHVTLLCVPNSSSSSSNNNNNNNNNNTS
jgi:hypothetical protein